MSKLNTPVNPFSTGPGGSRFELLVASYYLASLLNEEIPQGLEDGNLIFSVKLQQRNKDNPVDDIVIKTEKGTLSIQAKNSVKFTSNKPKPSEKIPSFYDALSQCWSLYKSENFNTHIDRFGIAFDISSYSEDARRNLSDTIKWAKTEICADSYLLQLRKFDKKYRYFEIFQDLLSHISQNAVDEQTTWDFIRHFVILPFDFYLTSGHSYIDLLNKLLNVSKSRSPDTARILFAIIYDLASTCAINGGELDYFSMEKKLPPEFFVPLNITQLTYKIQKKLESQTENKIKREKKSNKYIPEVFTEIPRAKDELRIFTDPILFLQKIVEDLHKIDTYQYNELLSKLGIEEFNFELPVEFQKPSTIQNSVYEAYILKKYVNERICDLELMDPYKEGAFSKYLNNSNTTLFDEIKHSIWTKNRSIRWDLESIERHLSLITAQIVIIQGKAASGKTNFVCNFADTTLKSRKQLSFYATGYDLAEGTISLKEYIVNCFNDNYSGKVTNLLSDIERICLKDNMPLIILIDGINEHPDIQHFRVQLADLIEEFSKSAYVKFILTCRSEYFEQRFSNLKKASFEDKTIYIQDLTKEIPYVHKKYMIRSYFRQYHIKCKIYPRIRDLFVENPLILRLFCDVYGNSHGDEIVCLEPVSDIRLYDLFSKYNKKIIEDLEDKYPESGFKRRYKRLLQELADYMLTKTTFSNIPISSISDDLEKIINILVNEGVILKKDLPEKTSIFDDSEVLNFTYDEFRDFILADFLVKKTAHADFDHFKEYYSKCISPESQVSEGIGKYIFTIVRNENNIQIEEFLKSEDNYNDLFLNNVFSINDSLIVEDDIERIKKLFQYDSKNVNKIHIGLMNKRNKTDYPNLNIWLFLDLVSKLDKEDYYRLVSPVFTSYLESICKSIENLLERCDSQHLRKEENYSLLEVLICLSPIIPTSYRMISSFDVFLKIADKDPKLSAEIIKKYMKNKTSLVSKTLSSPLIYTDIEFKDYLKKIN